MNYKFCQWYELYCKPNLKYNTQVGYLRIMEGHLKPHFGQYRLKAITSAALQEYANDLKMKCLSKSHLTGILSVFSAAMDYAVEPIHYLTANPMRYVKFPKVERKPRERIILTLDEWHRIISRFPAGSRYDNSSKNIIISQKMAGHAKSSTCSAIFPCKNRFLK